jgi:hypothetical protein
VHTVSRRQVHYAMTLRATGLPSRFTKSGGLHEQLTWPHVPCGVLTGAGLDGQDWPQQNVLGVVWGSAKSVPSFT